MEWGSVDANGDPTGRGCMKCIVTCKSFATEGLTVEDIIVHIDNTNVSFTKRFKDARRVCDLVKQEEGPGFNRSKITGVQEVGHRLCIWKIWIADTELDKLWKLPAKTLADFSDKIEIVPVQGLSGEGWVRGICVNQSEREIIPSDVTWHWIESFFTSSTRTEELVMSPEQQLFKEQAENTRTFVAVQTNKDKALALKNPAAHTCLWSDVLSAKVAYDEAVATEEQQLLGGIAEALSAPAGSTVGGGLQLPAAAMADAETEDPVPRRGGKGVLRKAKAKAKGKGGRAGAALGSARSDVLARTKKFPANFLSPLRRSSAASRQSSAAAQEPAAVSSIMSLGSARSTLPESSPRIKSGGSGVASVIGDLPDKYREIMIRVTPWQILHEGVVLAKMNNGHHP